MHIIYIYIYIYKSKVSLTAIRILQLFFPMYCASFALLILLSFSSYPCLYLIPPQLLGRHFCSHLLLTPDQPRYALVVLYSALISLKLAPTVIGNYNVLLFYSIPCSHLLSYFACHHISCAFI